MSSPLCESSGFRIHIVLAILGLNHKSLWPQAAGGNRPRTALRADDRVQSTFQLLNGTFSIGEYLQTGLAGC